MNADGPSRLPVDNSNDSGRSENVPGTVIMNLQTLDLTPVTSEHNKLLTNEDKVLSKVIKCVLEGDRSVPSAMTEELKPYSKRKHELSMEAGVLWGARVIIPQRGQAKVLEELYEAHPRTSKMEVHCESAHVVAKNE